MPSYAQLPIVDRLDVANTAITNTIEDPEMSALLGAAGYTPAKMAEGQALLAAALEAYGTVYDERGDKVGATAQLQGGLQGAQAAFSKHVGLARAALKDHPGLLHELRLDEQRARAQASWLAQARQFYARGLANDRARTLLGEVGLTEAELQAGLDRVGAVERSKQKRSAESGEAQDATDTRDKRMAPLDAWVQRFRDVARPTLADRPQLLEKLGFLARS